MKFSSQICRLAAGLLATSAAAAAQAVFAHIIVVSISKLPVIVNVLTCAYRVILRRTV